MLPAEFQEMTGYEQAEHRYGAWITYYGFEDSQTWKINQGLLRSWRNDHREDAASETLEGAQRRLRGRGEEEEINR